MYTKSLEKNFYLKLFSGLVENKNKSTCVSVTLSESIMYIIYGASELDTLSYFLMNQNELPLCHTCDVLLTVNHIITANVKNSNISETNSTSPNKCAKL